MRMPAEKLAEARALAEQVGRDAWNEATRTGRNIRAATTRAVQHVGQAELAARRQEAEAAQALGQVVRRAVAPRPVTKPAAKPVAPAPARDWNPTFVPTPPGMKPDVFIPEPEPGRLAWPVPGFEALNPRNQAVGQGGGWYGAPRQSPRGPYPHEGIDVTAETGVPAITAGAGRVIQSDRRGRAGNMVVVDHGDGLTTRYLHLDSRDVEPGDVMLRGAPVGTVGRTGNPTAGSQTHLHFETRQDGAPPKPIWLFWF